MVSYLSMGEERRDWVGDGTQITQRWDTNNPEMTKREIVCCPQPHEHNKMWKPK